ncbi:unnamed protein product [Ilex paraguariensis]|uniref:Leucine-rich repeat-containing N-terminal plant-type domain-containing protein n=1 Tax=Ilex paraguariensis TaxID=185542 RepID=A0ABC8S1E5_9AQUA
MALSFYLFVFMHFLFLLLCSHHVILSKCSSSAHQLCHENERFALLQLKHSLSIDKYASADPSAYPKAYSWGLQGNNSSDFDCCLWDGVECDENSGYIISLDLSSSLLYGSINSSSSLFNLAHLQRLNLADNNCSYSQIPSAIGHLSLLTSLNLSKTVFSGQIPIEILNLSRLASLDLSGNVDPLSSESLLKLEKSSLKSLVQNLSSLKELTLSMVNISSEIPNILANLSSLTSLLLRDCGLYGEFPVGIFHLPNLQSLSVRFNPNLHGSLPEFNQSSPLKRLGLGGTSFSGKIPDSIGKLASLFLLDLSECVFTGSLPYSLGGLNQLVNIDLSYNHFTGQIPPSFSNLTKLSVLSLSYNNFTGKTSSWVCKLTSLTELLLRANNMYGGIPSCLGNLTRLSSLFLTYNQLNGGIPLCLGNLTQLTHLDFGGNKFHGPIPQSIFTLSNLRSLDLFNNYLSGVVEVDMFLKLKDLRIFQLSNNQLSVLTSNDPNFTLPKFTMLGLESCNLTEFPKFLQYQDELEVLYLSNNKIHGLVPKWIWNMGQKTLVDISLSLNSLTGFEQLPAILPWESLRALELAFNSLQGSLPIPPSSISSYAVSNNFLTGEIPLLVCKASFLQFLDLSNNSLSGRIPQCLISDTLMILNLHSNNFHGTIPQLYSKESSLKVIDLSENKLDGPVPRSLTNCTMLELLNLGNNQINDIFPFWLGTLPELKILLLRSNWFHGTIVSHLSNFDFPNLRIIDLSFNGFTGELPSKYFKNWNVSKIHDVGQSLYFQSEHTFQALDNDFNKSYRFSMTMRNKGLETSYIQILTVFAAIDLSSNKFNGEIPESIGNLKRLQLLNLSNNGFVGKIPSSLGNLTELQALDLSQNELSGGIPQQLTQLTFLAFLNVSHNHLIGPIPRGNQFGTFENVSFDGNPGLCGDPLSKKCGSNEASPPPPLTINNENSDFPSKFEWIFICMGYGSRLVIGLVIGHFLITCKHEWFEETFAWVQQKRTKKKVRQAN